jgi:GTP-binding protein EngB required for normal cell division
MTEISKKRNILLLGRTGQGKSSLGNLLINKNENLTKEGFKEIFKEGGNSISQTKNVKGETFELEDYSYQVVDTPGLGDTSLKQRDILFKIAEACKKVENGIFQIFFVNGEKFTLEEIYTYNIIREIFFDDKVSKYTTIVRTKFDNFEDEKSCKEDLDLLTNEGNESIKKMIDSCERKLIYIDNPSIDPKLPLRKIKSRIQDKLISKKILSKYLSEINTGNYKPKNLDNLGKKIDFHILEKNRSLEKRLEELERKLEELEKGINVGISREDLNEEMEKIKELIELNRKILEKGFFEILGSAFDRLIENAKDLGQRAYISLHETGNKVYNNCNIL